MNYNDDILESDVGKFTNLHAHCRIASPLDGFSDIEDYVIRAKAMGMRGVLFSDHGLMSAAYELEKICKKHDMKPIYANELYFTPNDPLKKEKTEGFKPSYHLLLIAYNQEGYLNLMKLSSDAWTKYRYYKPRISWEQLEQHKNGIICLQACFTPGNAALTENGYSYIEDVSCDVFNGKGIISTATKTSRPYNGKVKDIKIKYGFPINCTDSHKFLYIAKNNLNKNIVSFDDNFKIGDYMLIPSSSLDYFVSSDITNSLSFILGAYAAEGCTTLVGNERCNAELDWTHFSLHQNETLFIQKIIENSKQIDPSSISSLKYRSDSLSVTVSIKSEIIANACRKYIGHYSDKKNIAKEILFGTKDIKSYFLSGYCYGDGYYRITKARESLNIKETPEFTSASVSKLMTYSLSYMMTSLGIKNSISIVDAKIDKNNICHKESYYLRCYGKSALFIKSLMDYVDTGNMQSIFENQFKKIELNGTGYFLNKIMDINSFDYKGDVHCLNVPDTNMFVVSSVATSNCLGGFVAQMVLENKVEDAEDAIKRFKAIYGDNYYLEMQWTGIEEQNLVNSFFREMSAKLNVPLVITCDSHYTWKHESELHRALVTINTGGIFKKKSEAKIGELTDDKDTDESSLFYTPGEYYLKPYHVMKSYFNKPEDEAAFANTNKIAEMCNVVLPKNLKIFPQLIEDPETYIQTYCLLFLNDYCKDMTDEKKNIYLERFKEEFWIISRMGYCDYFVVVADIISYAKQNNILTGPGRGSAAGCLISFCLQITWIDPIKYNLLFSRFLSSSRAKMPLIEFDEYPIVENL